MLLRSPHIGACFRVHYWYNDLLASSIRPNMRSSYNWLSTSQFNKLRPKFLYFNGYESIKKSGGRLEKKLKRVFSIFSYHMTPDQKNKNKNKTYDKKKTKYFLKKKKIKIKHMTKKKKIIFLKKKKSL